MLQISQPVEHAQRRQLNDEVHARPPDSMVTPCSVTYLVRIPAGEDTESMPAEVLADLLQRYGMRLRDPNTKHFATRLDGTRLRWERHTEYTRYTLVDESVEGAPFARDERTVLPADWLQTLRGEVIVAVKTWIVAQAPGQLDADAVSEKYFNGNVLVGARIADGAAIALTDLRIHDDGFSRFLLFNESMSDAQTGRVLQRLLEIETYRVLALLALPVAQQLVPVLDADERELTDIGQALVDASAEDEQDLLERLTRLSAGTQHRQQRSNYRFAAADAYYEIVLQRILELRESRIPGLQTFGEFMNRRLAPAVKTYRAVSKRQRYILEQMARATKLLSTRIDIARQQQNQTLLASMNRRVKAQLRLQATVEGLSVAAVTYYVVGLVGIAAESLSAYGVAIDKSVTMGISIPIVAAIAFLGIRRLRKSISQEEAGQ
jgi:uncharacterized membrane-anchored protein